MGQGKRYSGEIRDEVQRHRDESGLNSVEILDALAVDERFADELPDTRTIQRWLRDLKPRDTTGPWSLGSALSVDEVRHVPRVWAAFAGRRSDRTAGVTRREAELAARIATALPDLRPWDVWRLVVAYMRREDRKIDTGDLDFLVGCASEWCRPDKNAEQREKARRAHFERHRVLWPEREYLCVYAGPEIGALEIWGKRR
jgi:hypothetical protein